MSNWHPHTYRNSAPPGGDPEVIKSALTIAQITTQVNASLPPVFTLRHLAHIVAADYGLLRGIVSRKIEDPYTVFRIPKPRRSEGKQRFRIICVPDPTLLKVQRWINNKILSLGQPHQASKAFARGNRVPDAAGKHCGCRWLIKFDVVSFFESISEIAVHRVFAGLGYQPLVAFEMTRLCTRLGKETLSRRKPRWYSNSNRYSVITAYRSDRVGHLPQGAPTSPMLSNLAVSSFDEKVSRIATELGIVYTRYADDLALSTSDPQFDRSAAQSLIGKIYKCMGEYGLSPNVSKTQVCPPGSRKIVLGLLVDGDAPRLTRQFKASLRQHLFYLLHPQIGPAKHANRRGFVSVAGLRNHIEGLVGFAKQIDAIFGTKCLGQLRQVKWPV